MDFSGVIFMCGFGCSQAFSVCVLRWSACQARFCRAGPHLTNNTSLLGVASASTLLYIRAGSAAKSEMRSTRKNKKCTVTQTHIGYTWYILVSCSPPTSLSQLLFDVSLQQLFSSSLKHQTPGRILLVAVRLCGHKLKESLYSTLQNRGGAYWNI